MVPGSSFVNLRCFQIQRYANVTASVQRYHILISSHLACMRELSDATVGGVKVNWGKLCITPITPKPQNTSLDFLIYLRC